MRLIVFLFIFLFAMPFQAIAETVTVKGVGETKEAAGKRALRDAVEQVVGAYIKSSTKVSMGVLDYDKIVSSTDGLIESYSEIDSQQRGDEWEVILKVSVNPKAINGENIKNYITDRKKMRVFTKDNFGNRSVLVMYSSSGCESEIPISKDSTSASALIHTIEGHLVDKSFDVILESRYDHRLHGILLVSQCINCYQVSTWLGQHSTTVERWVKKFEKHGFAGLQDGSRPGRPRRLTETQREKPNRDLRADPRNIGYEQNLWDGKLLQYHLNHFYKVKLGVRQCQRLFGKMGFRLRKPRPVIAHADHAVQRSFKKTAKDGKKR